MRSLIFVRAPERTDLDHFAPQVQKVRDAFDRYLDSYPIKTARTKTSLMGPVGKVLSEVRSGRWDAESLTGYALNIHLMNPNAHGFIGQEAREALHEGVTALTELIGGVPPAAQDRLIDRIDYGLYWVRRRKAMEFMEQVQREFADFLRRRYQNAGALNQAWGVKGRDQVDDFSRAPYPSKRGKRYSQGNEQLRNDVDIYWQERGEAPADSEDDEE